MSNIKVWIIFSWFQMFHSTLLHIPKWEDYLITYGKTYNSSELLNREKIYNEAVSNITKFNSESHFYKQGVNWFSDYTTTEFKSFLGLSRNNRITGKYRNKYALINQTLPNSLDWRDTKGAVTHVKNQMKCGSCAAFAAVGALEGQNFLRNNVPNLSLSEQYILDCSKETDTCHGGGLPWLIFDWCSENHSLDKEECRPYLGHEGLCPGHKDCSSGIKVSGYKEVPHNDENGLLNAVAFLGPVAVGVDGTPLQKYSSGILDDPTCTEKGMNHAVLVIGYGTENGKDYWLCKNSWSTKWGMAGFFKMARNANNMCGVASNATIPILA